MLDSDISTAGALRHVTTSELAFPDAHSLDRRRFLQLVGMGVGAGLVTGPGSSLLDSVLAGTGSTAWAAGPIGVNDGILVVIGMFGGNDGLNTVVPITDGLYYADAGHGALAIPAAQTLPINATTGLNPELTALKEFWDHGQLAIVEGVGYPDPDLSHFNSMAKWMSGTTSGIPSSGWVGRWLDGHLSGSKNLFAAAEVGHSLPLHMIGHASRATTIPASRPSFGAQSGAEYQRQYQTIRNMNSSGLSFWERQVSEAFTDQLDVAKTIAPAIPEVLPDTDLVARLEVAARLINANLGFRVMSAGWGDFDSHAGQPDQHPIRMQELNQAIRRFYEVLHADWKSRVTFMTYSEFGRTSQANLGAGTDHGTSAPHFVFGTNVKGGMYGQRPTLAGLGRWDRMAHHVDFRDYYGSVIDGWLGGGGSDVLGKSINDLGLFERAPGAGPGFTPEQLGAFVPITPFRLVDTREGVGASAQKIGPGGSIVVKASGVGGLPSSGIRAVVVNVTATEVGAPTYLTVYPTGITRPLAANLTPSTGRDASNLVVPGVSDAGEFTIYNSAGSTHCVVDITGYYSTTGSARLRPLVPSRVLDTREGNGAPLAKVRGGQTIDVMIAGRGGVPATGTQSVVLNVATVDATQPGFVAVHAHGDARPFIASVSYRPGEVIPNLVMCKVGASGMISLYASHGEVNLVADVVGSYGNEGSMHVPVTPVRILDTREGNGAPMARVAPGQAVSLRVRGRGGVPENATAVVMNVTAVAASAAGYITVYPDGVTRPLASSLNVAAGQTVPNLVVSEIGTNGNVSIYSERCEVDIVADVSGFFM